MAGRKRQRKPSAKVSETTETWNLGPKGKPSSKFSGHVSHMICQLTSYSTNFCILLCTEWCRVYCEEDGKCHTVSARSLELEDSEVLTLPDLTKGNSVLLNSKGSKFSCTIVEVFGKLKLATVSILNNMLHRSETI